MEIVNLRHWYSTEQVKELTGFLYYMQVHRWRTDEDIVYTRLCGLTLYFRDSVNTWLENRIEMFKHRAVTIRGQTHVFKRRDYQKLVDLSAQILNMEAYDIDLRDWQPYCMLVSEPHPMYLSRLINNQRVLPQVRHKAAYGLRFYNVKDIQREFK